LNLRNTGTSVRGLHSNISALIRCIFDMCGHLKSHAVHNSSSSQAAVRGGSPGVDVREESRSCGLSDCRSCRATAAPPSRRTPVSAVARRVAGPRTPTRPLPSAPCRSGSGHVADGRPVRGSMADNREVRSSTSRLFGGNSSAIIDSPSCLLSIDTVGLAASCQSDSGGTCTRGLRISRPIAWTITAISSSPRVRLRSITNSQGSPWHRLTIMISLSSSMHAPAG
jgi:hypothetical protein